MLVWRSPAVIAERVADYLRVAVLRRTGRRETGITWETARDTVTQVEDCSSR